MKAKDLMIGDYIQDFTGDLCQVIVIDRQVAQVETLTGVLQGDTTRYLHEAEGVPLTPEILEKNFGIQIMILMILSLYHLQDLLNQVYNII